MKRFYVTNDSFLWHQLLRRTLQGLEQYATGKNVLLRYKRKIAAHYYGSCHPEERGIFGKQLQETHDQYNRLHWPFIVQFKDPSFLGMTRQRLCDSSSSERLTIDVQCSIINKYTKVPFRDLKKACIKKIVAAP